MKRKYSRGKQCLILAIMMKTIMTGTWNLGQEENYPKLTQNEMLKINLNNSLTSFSRFEILQKFEESDAKFIFGFDKEEDYEKKTLDLGFEKKCYGLKQISKFEYGFFCKRSGEGKNEGNTENDHTKIFVNIKNDQKKNFKIFDLTHYEIQKGYSCDDIVESYEKGNSLIACKIQAEKKIKILLLKSNEDSPILQIKNEKNIEKFPEKFDFEKLKILSNLAFVGKQKTLLINFISINFSTRHLSNHDFFTKTIFYSERSGFFRQQRNYEFKDYQRILEDDKLDYITKVETDGRNLFMLTVINTSEEHMINLQSVEIGEFLNFRKKFKSELIFSAKLMMLFERHRISVPNSQLAILNPFEDGEIYDPEKIIKFVIYRPYKTITIFKISNKGKILKKNVIDEKRKTKMRNKLKLFTGMETVGNTVVFYGSKGLKNRRIAFWHTDIEKDLDTYDTDYSLPCNEPEGDFLLVEGWSEEFYPDFKNLNKTFRNKQFLFLSPNGTLISGEYQPPAVLFNFPKVENKSEYKKIFSELNSYNEEDLRWKRAKIDIDLVKRGGVLELENSVPFTLNIYKKGNIIVHLPDVVKGNAVSLNYSLYPNLKEISPIELKKGFFNLQGINMYQVTFFKMFGPEFIILRYKNYPDYMIFQCTKMLTEIALFCKKTNSFKLGEGEKIAYVLENVSPTKMVMIVQTAEFEYKRWIISATEESELNSLAELKNIKILSGYKFEKRFWFIGAEKDSKTGKIRKSLFYLRYTKMSLKFDPVRVPIEGRTQEGAELDFKEILRVTRIETPNKISNSVFQISIMAPSFTILKIIADKMEDSRVIYSANFGRELPNGRFLFTYIEKKWVNFIDFNQDLKHNMKNIRIKTNKNGDIQGVGYYEIFSNYNKEFFNNIFKTVFQVKTFCTMSTCYGFFNGETRDGKYSLLILDLDSFKDPSNRVLGELNLEKKVEILKIEFDCSYRMFQIHTYTKPTDHRIYYFLTRQTPFLLFNTTKIEGISSKGKVFIDADYHNLMRNEVKKLASSVLIFHENEMFLRYKIPAKPSIVDNGKQSIINLDKLLSISDWIYDIELGEIKKKEKKNIFQLKEGNTEKKKEKNGNRVIKRIEKIKNDDLSKNCLKQMDKIYAVKLGKIRATYHNNHTIMLAVAQSVKNTFLRYYLATFDPKTGQCHLNAFLSHDKYVDFALYSPENFIEEISKKKKKSNNHPSFFFVTMRFLRYSEFTLFSFSHFFYNNGKYEMVQEERKIEGIGYRRKCSKITKLFEKLNCKYFLLTVCRAEKDSESVEFSIIKLFETNSLQFEHFSDFPDLKNLITGVIKYTRVAVQGDFFVVFIQQKFKNYLVVALFEMKNGGVVFIKAELSYLRDHNGRKKSDKTISELGLWSSKIELEEVIIQRKIKMFLGTQTFFSYFFEVEFENFMRVKLDKKYSILKNGEIFVKKKIQNANFGYRISKIEILGDYVRILTSDGDRIVDKLKEKRLLLIYNISTEAGDEKKLGKDENEFLRPVFMKKFENVHMKSKIWKNDKNEYFLHTAQKFELVSTIEKIQSDFFKLNKNFELRIEDPASLNLKSGVILLKKLSNEDGKEIEVPLRKFFQKKRYNHTIAILILLVLLCLALFIILKLKEKMEERESEENSDDSFLVGSLELDKSLNSFDQFEGISIIESSKKVSNEETGANLIDDFLNLSDE